MILQAREQLKKGRAMKHLFSVIVIFLLAFPIEIFSDENSSGASIKNFKTQSLYRAVELKWEVIVPFVNEDVGFQIIRSDSFMEGPYEEIAIVPYDKNKKAYEFLDRTLGSESKYYYKLIIRGTGETYGPVAARPYFSPPAT